MEYYFHGGVMSIKKFLGQRIQEIRKSKKLTQPALAELVSVDAKYISRIETGNSYPSLDTLDGIAKALDIEVKELFNSSHLRDKDELIKKINQKLVETNIANVKLFYQILNDILNTQ